jgi:hypothetical protein
LSRSSWCLRALALIAAAAAAASAQGAGGTAGDIAALRVCGTMAPLRRGVSYRYVILQAWEYGRIRAIKRRFPGVKVLVYKDMASTRQYARNEAVLPAGVGYAYANRRHPEWFLKDTQGHRVEWRGWPGSWQMDVGNAGYQAKWASNVGGELRRRGWDGVFVDGIVRTLQRPAYLAGRVLAKYPGPDDYAHATTRFLDRVGPYLLRRHALVLGNINDADLPLWQRWVGDMSGASREWWTKASTIPGSNFLTGAAWWSQMQLLRAAHERGKIFLAISYGKPTDAAAMEYARASFLLFAGGARSAFTYSTGCATEPGARAWRENLGSPSGDASRIGPAWRRAFSRGLVLVNPSTEAATVAFGGTYVDRAGKRVTRVQLKPHTAALLRRP